MKFWGSHQTPCFELSAHSEVIEAGSAAAGANRPSLDNCGTGRRVSHKIYYRISERNNKKKIEIKDGINWVKCTYSGFKKILKKKYIKN